MNTLSRLPESEQVELHSLFPNLLELHVESIKGPYQQLAFSIFKHQLNEEECQSFLADVAPAEQLRRNRTHEAFVESLLATTRVLTLAVEPEIEPHVSFFSFVSSDAARAYFEHTSNQRYVAILPAYRAVYFEGFDDTNQLFFFAREFVEPVVSLAQRMGLYVW